MLAHRGRSAGSARIASLEAPDGIARVFPVIGRFALPDGSEATVRARRLVAVPGASTAKVEHAERAFWRWLSEFAQEVEAPVLRTRYDGGAREGRFAEIELSAARVTFAEFRRPRAARLRMRDVRVVLEDVVINPFSAVSEGRLEPLHAGRLRLERATITAADLARFLGELPKMRVQVSLHRGALAVRVDQFGPDVTGRSACCRCRRHCPSPSFRRTSGLAPWPFRIPSWAG